jgi:hypothetical protein
MGTAFTRIYDKQIPILGADIRYVVYRFTEVNKADLFSLTFSACIHLSLGNFRQSLSSVDSGKFLMPSGSQLNMDKVL